MFHYINYKLKKIGREKICCLISTRKEGIYQITLAVVHHLHLKIVELKTQHDLTVNLQAKADQRKDVY